MTSPLVENAREDAAASLESLEAGRRQIQDWLDRLDALAERLQEEPLDGDLQAEAGAIEAFFSGTARRHPADEERSLFPSLLTSPDPARVAGARRLQQDHGWIEQNWNEMGPRLRALSEGNHWVEPEEFLHDAAVFRDLWAEHLALGRELGAGLAG
jgi:hypothetical protein